MRHISSLRGPVAASALTSVLTVTALWVVSKVTVSPETAFAQQGSPDVVLYTGPRGDDDRESFIFYNHKTGEIWVYRNQKFRNHYRLRALGVDLQEVADRKKSSKAPADTRPASSD